MKFKAEIDLGNSAFEDSADELSTLIENIAKRVRSYQAQAIDSDETIQDSNGNTVGRWTIK